MIAALALAAAIGLGQDREIDGFDIIALDDSCAISTDYDIDGRPSIGLRIYLIDENVVIVLESSAWSIREGEEYEVDFQFDRQVFTGPALGMRNVGDGPGFSTKFAPEVLDSFARANTMLVRRGDAIVAHLNLRSSGRAVQALRQCDQQVKRNVAAQARREARWDYIAPDPFAAAVPDRVAPLAATIENPTWARFPAADFPERAQSRGLTGGAVTLDCRSNPDGSLSDCNIVSETPAGAGFGQAVLAASRRARLSPRSLDSAAAGARVRFTQRFEVEGSNSSE